MVVFADHRADEGVQHAAHGLMYITVGQGMV